MKQTFSYGQKARQFFAVLLPIFITQLALTATGFFNTVMAGHVSEQDLAGVAVGVNLFFPFFVASMGIISGLTPTISQLYGGGKPEKIRFIVQQGFYWSVVLAGIFLLLGFLITPWLLPELHLEPRVDHIVRYYLLAIAAGIVPIFLAGVLRNFIDSHGATRITMCITMFTVPLNIVLNFFFMYGICGFPVLGGIGAGVGSGITYFVNLLLNVLVVCRLPQFASYRLFQNLPRPCLSEWRKQLGIGIPIGATMFCESSIFGAVGLFMTIYGTTVVAAHQAALNFSTVVYMIPMSISMALTILVGYELGAKRQQDAKRYSRIGRLLSFLFTAVLASVLIQCRDGVAALYTSNPAVKDLLRGFLVYAVVMQVSDGIDAPLQGTLRGYKDVHVTFMLAVISYWVIGLPGGWLLAGPGGFGPYGYWIGLIVGVLAGAVFLMCRLYFVERKYQKISLK